MPIPRGIKFSLSIEHGPFFRVLHCTLGSSNQLQTSNPFVQLTIMSMYPTWNFISGLTLFNVEGFISSISFSPHLQENSCCFSKGGQAQCNAQFGPANTQSAPALRPISQLSLGVLFACFIPRSVHLEQAQCLMQKKLKKIKRLQ